MPTIAAGTFSLNCAYLGIPCIGNRKVDTQKICFPLLSVEPENVDLARDLAYRLKTDVSFYKECSECAKINYKAYYSLDTWKEKMYSNINR
jgi:recombinational DNA repair protein RecR